MLEGGIAFVLAVGGVKETALICFQLGRVPEVPEVVVYQTMMEVFLQPKGGCAV